VLSFPYPLRFIRRYAPHPSGQLKLFNASLLSVRYTAGGNGQGAGHRLPMPRYSLDQKSRVLSQHGPNRRRYLDPALR